MINIKIDEEVKKDIFKITRRKSALRSYEKQILINFKEHNRQKESILHNFIKNGELMANGESITEGIGTSRITENFKEAKVDEAFQIDDVFFKLLKDY